MGTEKETIDQFAGWENPSQQHDFFGETNLQDNVDVVTQALEDDATLTPEEKEKAKVLFEFTVPLLLAFEAFPS